MFVPSAFRKLCFYFHQDIGLDDSTFKEWVAFAGSHLDETEKQGARTYAGKLLDGNYSGDELQRIWFSTDAEVSFPKESVLRRFLALIRDTL